MILVDNIKFLKQRFSSVWNILKISEPFVNKVPIRVISSKSGQPTLMIEREGQQSFIHSKYDPINEAEKFVGQYVNENIGHYKHILFYGVGLGYHISAFMEKYPGVSFSLYEPNPAILYHYLSNKSLRDLPLKSLKNIYAEANPDQAAYLLKDFLSSVSREGVLLIVLPSYERIFKKDYENFITQFKNSITERKTGLNINLAFEKRWTLNSLINLPHILNSPDILHDIDKEAFKNKPVLLVSAGPSLQEEIEHIRAIKENGTAYIFAVGSSILSLLSNGIYPDAVCSYDPQSNTYETYLPIIEQNIESIPLIYGSSVGFETVQKYPGPKVHMITSQDTVTPYYLRESGKAIQTVLDAPTIAAVTLELLYKLGANPIILVGQNLAYKDEQFYAQGIQYATSTQKRPTELTEEDRLKAITVKDVYGNYILTNDGFNRMRKQMEAYIASFANVSVINTTKGGAKIEGAPFIPMEQVMENYLQRRVVEEKWYHSEKEISKDVKKSILLQCDGIEKKYEEFIQDIKEISRILHQIEKALKYNNFIHLDRMYPRLDKAFKKIYRNLFYTVFIHPMNRVQNDLLGNEARSIRLESDPCIKARKVINSFGSYIYECSKYAGHIFPIVKSVHAEIRKQLLSEKTEAAEV